MFVRLLLFVVLLSWGSDARYHRVECDYDTETDCLVDETCAWCVSRGRCVYLDECWYQTFAHACPDSEIRTTEVQANAQPERCNRMMQLDQVYYNLLILGPTVIISLLIALVIRISVGVYYTCKNDGSRHTPVDTV